MAKVPGKLGFSQPEHGTTGATTAKNKGKLGFEQPNKGTGKTSTKKSPGKLGFTQKTAPITKNSTAKNKGSAPFAQPKKGGSAAMPKETASAKTANAPMKKVSGSGKPVAPKTKSLKSFKSTDDLIAFRKKKFGV